MDGLPRSAAMHPAQPPDVREPVRGKLPIIGPHHPRVLKGHVRLGRAGTAAQRVPAPGLIPLVHRRQSIRRVNEGETLGKANMNEVCYDGIIKNLTRKGLKMDRKVLCSSF